MRVKDTIPKLSFLAEGLPITSRMKRFGVQGMVSQGAGWSICFGSFSLHAPRFVGDWLAQECR